MTEVSILFADPMIPWYQTANTLHGFIWIEQGGQVVGGSMTAPNAVAPAKTGNTPNDLKTWVQAALLNLMGAIPPDAGYVYPIALPAFNDWGINVFAKGNGYKDRPFVALAYTDDFKFGALNIPVYQGSDHPETERHVFFKITGSGTPDNLSPAEKLIKAYNTANGKLPILLALELNPE
jgi:hypothetical protein